ncbi:hypothetical protein XFF6992_310007 [Xanthomonas citri pv. fuscans]|nr:hypothetical protein XFF6992_310007 [Xanthomonas citri pv. fuscans]SOO33155.1 hypothetical protein XFF6994_2660029 [Xanthomonas citri pv. fuscans]
MLIHRTGWHRIGIDLAFGRQAAGDPVLQRDVVQAAHRLDHHTAWCGGRWHHLHRHQERLPVLRSASGLAAVALAARIGIVDLHETGQFAHGLALGHDLHDLVLHPQGAFVVDAQMAHQLQRDHVGLGRGQQLQGQHQCAQRQLGALEHRASDQAGLVPTRTALVVDDAATLEARAHSSGTARAAKSLQPPPLVKCAIALRAANKTQEEVVSR